MARIKSPAAKAAPGTTPARDEVFALKHVPGSPDDHIAALAEAETLVWLLLGLPPDDREAEQVAALRARGWGLFRIDGEIELPAGVRALHPLLIREFTRLQSAVRAIATPEVLAAFQRQHDRDRARRAAQCLHDRAAGLLAELDAEIPDDQLRQTADRWTATARALLRPQATEAGA